ncbi:MAG: 1-acyl-sn-glycerol-3-phosphate acyltransferase [Saprospiraceae bacterium]|nr:1-acyl-sn-glycerol-3-phosphate acyltransferase [Saprospiraceae bacterium]
MIRLICRLILYKIWGFRYTGHYPGEIAKKLYIVYPHTSNWDFPIGILLKGAIPMEVNYVGKDSLFKWPYGWFFRWLGGIPVNRSQRSNFVEMMVGLYNKYDRLSFALAPEGTRKRVRKFRSGFYYIALKADIPLVMVKFDFKNKVVNFSEPFKVSGDYKTDLKFIIHHFKGTQGKNPKLACQWEDEDL